MAEKKENKAIGYLVIGVIPIIGIIWAAVAGVQHNGYVEEAQNAERAFETKLVEKINELDLCKDNDIVVSDLNVTSIQINYYATKLKDDKINSGSSYSVRLSANPKTSENEAGEITVDSFAFEYEFFITNQVYTEFSESFEQEKLGVVGYKDYVYQTYYSNNPRSTPIYALDGIFDKYYANTLYFEYNDDVLYGFSPETVIELIDELPDQLNSTTTELKQFKASLDAILTEYNLLTEEEKAQVTNFTKYEQAQLLYGAKVVENSIDALVDNSEYTLSASRKAEDARSSYNKLTEEQKAMVNNVDKLIQKEFDYPILKSVYYLDKYIAENDIGQLRNAVKFYNELSDEQKAAYDAAKKASLVAAVDAYNADDSNKTKLELK